MAGLVGDVRSWGEERKPDFGAGRTVVDPEQTLSGFRRGRVPAKRVSVLLVAHPDFTDDIEIRPFGLEHEKFPHTYCGLKKNVSDVEIVGNHHQIRGAVVFQRFLQNAFIV